MNSFDKHGDTLTVVAPYAVASGGGIKIGALIGIASGSAPLGGQVEMKRTGVFFHAAPSADVCTTGTKLYWDDTAKLFTTTATSNTLAGAAAAPKAAGATTVSVLLDGVIR
jgi:predicted RecA/RadA family phage recombinase